MSGGQRIDKWLWHARMAKTRTLAAGLVTGGHVRLNRERVVKPSQPVRPGDVLTVALRGRILVLRIEALADRRGPAAEAALLYADLSPAPSGPGPRPDAAPPQSRPSGSGRPTKRDRRRLQAWKDDLRTPNDEEI